MFDAGTLTKGFFSFIFIFSNHEKALRYSDTVQVTNSNLKDFLMNNPSSLELLYIEPSFAKSIEIFLLKQYQYF